VIDPEIEKAIRQVVKNNNQSSDVANRLIAWLNEVAIGNVSLEKPSEFKRHLEIFLSAIEGVIVE
jgi:hypothetical protein